jgi:hypothetical protein
MSAEKQSSEKTHWERLIAAYDRKVLSSLELQSKLFDHIRQAPSDFEAVVAALRRHPEEFMREYVADDLERNVAESRKVIDYDTEAMPLDDRIGCRVKVFGGYTATYQPEQAWLGGKASLTGALYGPLKIAQDRMPVAAIKLDGVCQVFEAPHTRRGEFLLLAPRYVGHDWSEAEGVAYAYLVERLPRDNSWWRGRDQLEIESHASYRFLAE